MDDEIDWECENCGRLMGTSDSRPGLQVCDNCGFTRPISQELAKIDAKEAEEDWQSFKSALSKMGLGIETWIEGMRE